LIHMTSPFRRTLPAISAAAAALLCTGILAGCGSSSDSPSSDGPSGGTSPSTTAADSTDSTTAPSTSSGNGETGLVYYVTKTSRGQKLIAETTPLPDGDPVDAALRALGTDQPIDPDYTSLVPAGSLTKASIKGTSIEVTVASGKWAAAQPGQSKEDAKLAVQQVAYTLNAAAGRSRRPLPVHFSSGFLGQPASAQQAGQLDTLALMNVLTPADGATLSGDKATFTGLANSNEANVVWQIDAANGAKVLSGATMASGWMDRLYPWKATVSLTKLDPGTYTFVASTDSEGEGGGPDTDSKTFTVR